MAYLTFKKLHEFDELSAEDQAKKMGLIKIKAGVDYIRTGGKLVWKDPLSGELYVITSGKLKKIYPKIEVKKKSVKVHNEW